MPKKKNPWWVWLLPLPIVWWTALLAAGSWVPGKALFEQLPQLSAAMNHPLSLCWTEDTLRFLLLFRRISSKNICTSPSQLRHHVQDPPVKIPLGFIR